MQISESGFKYHNRSIGEKLDAPNAINEVAIYYANQLYPEAVSMFPKKTEDVTVHLNCMLGTNEQPGIGIIFAKRDKRSRELTDIKILTSAVSWEELYGKLPNKNLQNFIANL